MSTTITTNLLRQMKKLMDGVREHDGQFYYAATPNEMADPEWRARFAANYPNVKLIENKPITMGKPNV